MTIWFLLWPVLKTLLWIVLAFAGYALILRRLADAAQPARLRLAEEGEALLAEGNLGVENERQVRIYLENAFSGKTALIAALAIPIAMIWLVFQQPQEQSREVEARLSRLGDWFALSVFAANPIFGIVVAVEIILLGTTLAILTGSFSAVRAAVALLFRSDRGALGWFRFAP